MPDVLNSILNFHAYFLMSDDLIHVHFNAIILVKLNIARLRVLCPLIFARKSVGQSPRAFFNFFATHLNRINSGDTQTHDILQSRYTIISLDHNCRSNSETWVSLVNCFYPRIYTLYKYNIIFLSYYKNLESCGEFIKEIFQSERFSRHI